MSRIFFDSMMFVYLLEDNPHFAADVKQTLQRCYEREDTLLTSCLAVGEVMAGGSGVRNIADIARTTIPRWDSRWSHSMKAAWQSLRNSDPICA